MNFNTQLSEDFIPRIERMLEREKKHLETLKANKNTPGCMVLWVQTGDVDDFIAESEASIKHLELRLSEYRAYAGILIQ